MTSLRPDLHDPQVPALALLVNDRPDAVLQSIVGEFGVDVQSAKIGQVRYSPGRSVTVHYEAKVSTADAEAEAATYVVTAGGDVPGDVVRMEAGGVAIAVWRYPHDPYLPGLRAAADPTSTIALLEDLGVGGANARIRRRAYRAGRRAVIEVQTDGATLFLKVVRPQRVARLQDHHRRLATVLPVPRSLGWSQEHGIVVLEPLPGTQLRVLAKRADARLPGPAALIELLERFPIMEWPAPQSALIRAESHARLLGAVLPDVRTQLRRIVDRLQAAPEAPAAPVHGDFHASQILVDREGQICGLVDVDTAGSGARADDLAGLLAQLQVLALVTPEGDRVRRYAAELWAGFSQAEGGHGLRLRVAAAIVGFATGPFRIQAADWPGQTRARVRLAEEWALATNSIGMPPDA